MPSSALFSPMFTTAEARDAVSDRAWLQAMLDAEAALAAAEARLGVIPAEAAGAIATACDANRFDVAAIGAGAIDAANPVVPLVDALRAEVAEEYRGYVHYGATSQDILDTGAMLVTRRALDVVLDELTGACAACAALADRYRDTPMAGRTLMQQAVPIPFGLKAANWLMACVEAQEGLGRVREQRLAVQFGGAAGTLASLGTQGADVAREFAVELGLVEPPMPWHTNRVRIGEIGAALALAAGAAGKVAEDVTLLMQTEVGEASEPSSAGRGRSSTMPQKRNAVAMTEVRAAVRRVQAHAGVLFGAMAQEHERAAGAWQAEWEPLSEALALTAGAMHHIRLTLEGLDVSPERMRANLDASGGFVMAERVSAALGKRIGVDRAKPVIRQIAQRAVARGTTLREELLANEAVRAELDADTIEELLDPRGYMGSSNAFIDAALAAFRGSGRR